VVSATPLPSGRGAGAETASAHLVSRIPIARAGERAAAVVERLRSHRYDCIDPIYLVDAEGRIQGYLRAAELLRADPERAVEELAVAAQVAASSRDDQEQVAGLAIHHGLAAVPIVDAEARLQGLVPPEALMRILRSEHVEDLHRIAGILREDERARSAIESPPLHRVRDRLPWLFVGLAGSAVATAIVASFEGVLHAQVATAFFVPGLVYLADAIGTQTEAIAVRGISLSNAPLRRMLAGELVSGLLIGLSLALVALPLVWLGFGDARLALAVALALLGAGAVATGVGLLLPWWLAQLGRDPAFGSGPLATVIQDLLSLLIYFTTATLLLR